MMKHHVLVTEDDDLLRNLIAKICSGIGCKVTKARNGVEALRKTEAAKVPFDLVITDYRMPKMDGMKLIEAIRERFPHLETIMVTAHAEIKIAVEVMKKGAFDYIIKPIDRDLLISVVEKCLHHIAIQKRNLILQREKEADLQFGVSMQKKILTKESEVTEIFGNIGIGAAIFYKPPATVLGDFFLPKKVNDRSVGFLLGDSSGHGIGAAFLSMWVVPFAKNLKSPEHSTREFLHQIHSEIKDDLPRGQMIAANYTIFHPREKYLIFSNAWQPYPIFIGRGGIVEIIEVDGQALGHLEGRLPEIEHSFHPGDRFLLCTDGVIEATKPGKGKNRAYGENRLLKFVRENTQLPLAEFPRKIFEEVTAFTENTFQKDDITIAIFENQTEREER
jgi:CheY-like chemotaxis protein